MLTALGLYGMLARSVLIRTKEIGLRLAFGANPRDGLIMVVGEGLRLALTGTAIGLPLTLLLIRLLRSLLFGVQRTNPVMMAGVVAVLLVVASIASYIPARRGTKVDPMTALRYE